MEQVFLSIVVPTYNEAANVRRLVERIDAALSGTEHEIVFVDDSTDGTEWIIAELAGSHPHIRLIHRDSKRGLATAVVAGLEAARGTIVCVLDADLQHPPEAIPTLLEALQRTGADLAVASRHVPGGAYDSFTALRRAASGVATTIARGLLRRARPVSDPMSGFFAVRRAAIDGVPLRPVGYKILLEVLVRGRIGRVVEVPYRFEARSAGQSKLTMRQNVEYLLHLGRLIHVDPADLRFLTFAVVGGSGIAVNMGILWVTTRAGEGVLISGVAAILGATTWNFLLNDALTWRDVPSGRFRQRAARYGKYWMVTGIGSAMNLIALVLLTRAGLSYLLANGLGIVGAVIWNFRANGQWTWQPASHRIERMVDGPKSDGGHSSANDADVAGFRRRLGFTKYPQAGPVPEVEIITANGAAPRATVIIPVGTPGRSQTLDRLLTQLREQPFRACEIILVKGDTRQGRAINTGAALARGEILVTMDDDTQLGDREVLQKLVETLDRHPRVGMAGVANVVPPDAPAIVQRAMRELPRRSSPVVDVLTDSDMVEHPCLAIRKDLFYRVGGEHEQIPRGLDPYLRREVRRLGYRVVVIPHAWVHHMLPGTWRGIVRQYFRNGLGAAFVQKFHPGLVIEQTAGHDPRVPDRTALPSRAFRYGGRLMRAVISRQWIYLSTLLSYALGYAWGRLVLREDSL